jgi:hypothetical protein
MMFMMMLYLSKKNIVEFGASQQNSTMVITDGGWVTWLSRGRTGDEP